jgi:mycofactocin system FadH/OYE family oxidoreductase 2
VHEHDVPIFAQLNHNGGQASGMYSRLPVWAPSPVADPMFREVPKPVTAAEIREIIDGYATVARYCRQGGFDGIELQCSHSSIVRGFLSGTTNHRTDGYGGSLEHRARFLLEVLAAVRAEIGRDMALGVRLCGDELLPGGITIDQAVRVARMVEDSGHADYINTSIGVATSSLYMIEASMTVPPGYSLFIPSAIRKAVRLPVIGVGRFKDPLQAEHALAEGHADLIGVVRGQIADPDFAAKARAGRAEDIRLCLSCNQECVGRMGLGRWLGCIENPRAGREAVPVPTPAYAGRKRRVLIAGGGPGGLQAAISAAGRGLEVAVYERDDAPGGQVRTAVRAPGRAEFGDLVRNQLAECRHAGVEIKTGVAVDADLVRAERPDVVVVATGARPALPYWVPASPPEGAPGICDVRDVLDGTAHPQGRVIVVDELGFHQATGTAELLADHGCHVEIVTPGMVVGQDLGITLDLETWWLRATKKGIAAITDTMIVGVVPGGVTTQHLATGTVGQRAADWVVLAVQQAPVDELYFALKELRTSGGPEAGTLEIYRVGDCLAPRRAHAAVIDGDRIGGRL